ncbi:DUF6049 family protein [Williamsia phyllosphaerae]|uniref:Glycoprotein n=1 Tax=Williamsia phyllosphaerae TaxID=885042 RepID=A0ABQ1UDA8_9NOCA|nr:DUF6049 family protein [Williamsia phyllosphaerae]GGF16374.1 hypothetical protein GCM10007298_10510 [Williamsia phyllosphaerae]
MISTRPRDVRGSRHHLSRWAAVLGVFGLLLTTMLAAPLPGAAAAPFPEPAEFVNVSIDSVSPSAVTTSSPTTVTVRGTLNNVGDRPVTDLVMRVQRGDRVAAGAELRTSLIRDPAQYETATRFTQVGTKLDPGQSRPFSLTVPLTGNPATPGLGVDSPGVYPILVNLNGTPDYGTPARLDDSRTLLTVLGLPPDRARAQSSDLAEVTPANTQPSGADGSVAPTVSSPAQLTLMWPLAAPGQLAPGITGGGDEPVRLVSDDLATSLRPGGRLNGLLTTLDDATVSPDSPVTRSACLAIDPDLLVTVQAMTSGYEVSRDPTDPRSATREGTGTAAAQDWLQRLRTMASRLCVVALPFAQADLDTLARVNDPELTRTAVRSPADIVDTILGVSSVRGLAVPVSGALDDTAARLLNNSDIDHALIASTAIAREQGAANGQYRASDLAVQTYDPAITTALAGMGAAPSTPAVTADDQRFDLDTESQVSRRAAATAALSYAAIAPTGDATTQRIGGEPDDPTVGRSELIMPPAVWSASADDARAVLSTTALLLDSGLAAPRPLGDVNSQLDQAGVSGALRVPLNTTLGLTTLDADTTMLLSRSAGLIFQLEASMVARSDLAISPRTYVAPLDEDLIRAMRSAPVDSTSDRRAVVATAVARVRAVDKTLDRMRDAVSILDPGGRYTLASERSPLLLVVRNDLPLPVRVRLDTAAPQNLDIGDIGVVEIPPRGTRQIQLPTQAKSSATMTVNIALVTSSGVAMGSPIDLSVHSNAYGKALFIITICAGVALVLLAGRRLWHRFRGEPDPADLDRPEPDERERLMADSRYLHQQDTPVPPRSGSTGDD